MKYQPRDSVVGCPPVNLERSVEYAFYILGRAGQRESMESSAFCLLRGHRATGGRETEAIGVAGLDGAGLYISALLGMTLSTLGLKITILASQGLPSFLFSGNNGLYITLSKGRFKKY